jgi:hypothetical protein
MLETGPVYVILTPLVNIEDSIDDAGERLNHRLSTLNSSSITEPISAPTPVDEAIQKGIAKLSSEIRDFREEQRNFREEQRKGT